MRREQGFTLLEILVAAAIMGIAVAGVMSGLAVSVNNASRITQYDRAAMLAKSRMDEMLADEVAPRNQQLTGIYSPAESGGVQAGWQARIVPFEASGPEMTPGTVVVERIELEIWWIDRTTRRSFMLEGIRRGRIPVGVAQ